MDQNRSLILPEPWSVHVSKSRNLLYYFNRLTQESVWSPPKGTIIGGVVLDSDSAEHKENYSQEAKLSICPPNKAPGPTSAVVLPPDPKASDVTKQQIKITSSLCSRTMVDPEISTRSGDSSDGSGRVSSSMTRKRRLDKQYKPVDTESSASHNELRLDCTPAATRLENLRKLLTITQQRKSSGLSPKSASTSQGSSCGSYASSDKKECKVMVESLNKRQRLNVSGEGTRNAVETHAEIQPSCVVTSTTMTSSTIQDRGGNNSSKIFEPESPKVGEKLPYLDSDSDNASSSSSGKDASSSLLMPSPAWSNLHRKKNIRKKPFDPKTSPIVNNLPQPLQDIAGGVKSNIPCKTDKVWPFPKKKLFTDEQVSVNSVPNVMVSVQSRLSIPASDKGNSPTEVTSKTEQVPSIRANKNLFSDELLSGESSANSNVSVRSRLSSSSSDIGDSRSNVISRTESKPSVSQVKKLFSESASERCAPTARVSVQSRLSIAASCRDNIGSSNTSTVVGRSSLSPNNKLLSDQLPVERCARTVRESFPKTSNSTALSDGGSSSSGTVSRTEGLSADNKLLSDKLPIGRSASSTSVSVQSRLAIAASRKGNSQTSEGWTSECSRKRLSEELLDDTSCVAKRSVQSRLDVTTLNSRDSRSNVISRTESKPSVSQVKKLFSDGSASERCAPTARVSVQSRLSIAASGRDNIGSSNTSTVVGSSSVSPDNKLLSDQLSAERCVRTVKESFPKTSNGTALSDGNSQTSEGWTSECSRKRLSEELLDDTSCVAKRSVQSRLDVTTLNSRPPTSAQSTPTISSRINEQCSETSIIKNKLVNHSTIKPSDDNLSAIEKFRERIGLAVLPDGKQADNSPPVSSDKIGGEMKLSNQFQSGNFDRSGYDDTNVHEPTLWKSSSYESAVAEFRPPDPVSNCTEETMEVDALESPVKSALDHINNLQDDVASLASFVSEMPGTIAKGIKNCQEWVHEIRPPSPVDTYDIFPSEDLENDDEAMEWADIELDLSQVVSNLPTKTAKADEWFIVVDTNILIHSLSVIQELRDTPFPNLGLPVLVIPWQVLQELDLLKNQDNQHKSNDLALANKARWAIQFLNNNLKERHPRVRGQTAHDSEFEHYKRQGADDGILQCCLQLKEKGNFAVILTNDKNFANKAIVSGISSFTGDEIMDKLHEIALQTQSPVSQKQARETVSAGSPSDFEKTKYDLVFCHLKMLLKDILTEALTSGMKKVYGNMWLQRTGMKHPWTLFEIVCCIIRNWNTMKEHEFRQNTWPSKGEKLISCPQDIRVHLSVLQTFLKNTSRKCFDYLSRDMKYVINSSIEVCIGMTAVSFREKLIETINKLEILQDICKEKSRENVMNLLSDVQAQTSTATVPVVETERAQSVYVRQKFIEMWSLLSDICGSIFDVLKIKHDFKCEMKYEFENMKFICEKTSHVWPHLKALNKCFRNFEVTPEDELSEDHQLVMDLYFHMKNIHPDSDRDFDDTLSPRLVYTYMVHSKGRQIIMQLKEGFEKFEEQLMRGIIHISEKYPDFVNDNPTSNVLAENSARNDLNSGFKINSAYV